MKKILLMISLVMFAANVYAEEEPRAEDEVANYEILEMFGNNIKVSSDGTGIVKNVECKVCTSKILKITKDTKTYVDGKAADLVKIKKSRGNAVAMIRFDVASNEVILIRW